MPKRRLSVQGNEASQIAKRAKTVALRRVRTTRSGKQTKEGKGMNTRPSDEQCRALLKKHSVDLPETTEARVISAVREAYHAGKNADVMRVVAKGEKK